MKAAKPPQHLSKASLAFWTRIVADYAVDDPPGRELLRLACEALDTAETARQTIVTEGQVYIDRFKAPRAHPSVAIQRNAMTTAARLLRELGLSPDEAVTDFRPPAVKRR